MSFIIERPGGFFDIPDALFAAGNVAVEDILVALNSLVRFAATVNEYFATGPQVDGDTIALPQSPDDGYAYSRSECLYAGGMNYSPDADAGVNGGNGNVLYTYDYIEQDTGAVHSKINYYVQGGQDSNARDGTSVAMVCTRRGAGPLMPEPGTTGNLVGPTGGGSAGGGGNPTSGGKHPFGRIGDQGAQGDPRSLGVRGLVRL